MAKTSIGQFIAALRKANGMTQKQLAEKLYVSDKAVSRWERDECAPDLSLIPIIAEIFGVTSDEILRGERNTQESNHAAPQNSQKSEKRLERLLNQTYTRFSICSTITIGIVFLGLLAAMICNFGFYRAYIGFFVGCILYLAAVICEVIFTTLAYASLKGSDMESERLKAAQKKLFHKSCRVHTVTATVFAMTLPLALLPWDSYMGIVLEDWVSRGFLLGIIAIVICVVLTYVAETFLYPQDEAEKNSPLYRTKKRYVRLLIIVLLVTFVGQMVVTAVVSNTTFTRGTVFTDLEEFKAYMETPVDEYGVEYVPNGEAEEEEYPVDDILDLDGNIVGEYIWRNRAVVQINFDWDGEQPAFTTYTNDDLAQAAVNYNFMSVSWIVIYLLELIGFAVAYQVKKRKLTV